MPNIILKNDDKIITIQHTSAPYIVKSNDYNDLLNKPDLSVYATKIYVDDELAGKAEVIHVHTISDVTGLQSALNGKANSVHTHLIQDVTGLQSALDSKSATTHNHDGRYYTESETDAKLALKANASDLTSHTSNTSNPHNVTKAQVGLGNADNTSDASKPVSTAQAAAIALKADTTALTAHTSATNNPHAVTKAQVGLGNVDNTSDVNKPLSNPTKSYVDTADAAHVAAIDPHTQYMNSDRGDARYAGQPYSVMAKSQFASLSSSYGLLGRIFGNSGYKNDLQVYGLSTQAGTPTPAAPVPIVSTTGDVTVRSGNKNLVVLNGGTITTSGITTTHNADGSITLNGTASATMYPQINNLNLISIYTGMQLTMSSGTALPTGVKMVLRQNNPNAIYIMMNSGSSSNVGTVGATTTGLGYAFLEVVSGTTLNNVKLFPQIEVGSTPTSFEKNTTTTQTLPLGTTQLRSLPNGVSDRIYNDGSTWKLEQNVGLQTSISGTSVTISEMKSDSSFFSTAGGTISGTTITFASTVTGATVQYELTTPTTTTITDPTLITALENIRTYQGVTNITASTPVSGSYGLDTTKALAGKVDTTGNQTIAGVKTFTSAPIAPSGTSIGGALHLTGTGFPNGVVSAPVGSIYIDTAVTNGASSWIKKSGTGNTGWWILEGNTGWRRNDPANSWFLNGATPGADGDPGTRFRREGNVVHCILGLTTPAGWTNGTDFLAVPDGFRTPDNATYMPGGYSAAATMAVISLGTTATLRFYSGVVSNARFQWTWITNDPWPTTLPGIAV